MLLNLFEIVLPVSYFATTGLYAFGFFKNSKNSELYKVRFLIFTLIVHGIYIVFRTIEFNHPPVTTVFEILSLIAFTITITYAFIEIRTKNRTTGGFILIFPFIFQLISSFFIKELLEIPPVLRSYLLGFHVWSALVGYAAITISAVYGFLYLILYRDIKSAHFSVIYKRLPNLEMLERMSFSATVFGFVFLTIAISVGYAWLPRAIEKFSYADPKLISTIAVWLIYAAGLSAKKIIGWQGRKIMVLSMFGFIFTLFSMLLINIFFSSFHKFL
ncbi:MAG: cytochrome c biogenesis protein CcsA [Ignavibacteriales bacterium]|nr:cytochrome c biogenesis protein CcsA [Ignavibacteriales bacterium]